MPAAHLVVGRLGRLPTGVPDRGGGHALPGGNGIRSPRSSPGRRSPACPGSGFARAPARAGWVPTGRGTTRPAECAARVPQTRARRGDRGRREQGEKGAWHPVYAAVPSLVSTAGYTRWKVAIQLTSQLFPPSSEKACSKRNALGVMSEKTKRTRTARPSNVSWSKNSPRPSLKRP